MINNVLSAPAPESALLTELAKTAAAQQGFDPALTGATQLAGLLTSAQTNANAARADALKTTNDLHAQALATAGNIVGGVYGGGNFNAGSNAAAAVNGNEVKDPPPAPAAVGRATRRRQDRRGEAARGRRQGRDGRRRERHRGRGRRQAGPGPGATAARPRRQLTMRRL